MDVDHFKKVNDNHGHDAGDLVLQRVAEILTDSFAGPATLARYGGEEFVVLLPGSDIKGAKEQAEFFREKLADTPIESLKITVSMGVSFLKGSDENINNLIKRADDLLYVAKEDGRTCVKSEDVES